ncbi:MAG: hypothetical protein PHW72_01905 [Candidatus Pacebacteria bacterium]|nr:hypothetical protein [Candidatus Paceibacterota bacterium]
MFDFTGIKFESIGSLIGRIFHKEEYNEKTLNIELQKIKIAETQIGQRQYIEKQVINNIQLPGNTSTELIKAIISAKETPIPQLTAPEAKEVSGEAQLTVATASNPVNDFLARRVSDYQKNKNLLLDKGGLLYVYENRESIPFSEDNLVFLTQSSLKYDFPVWFWSFYYRESFSNIAPLFKKTYQHYSPKIRQATIEAMSKYTETEEEIVQLAINESDQAVLGFIIAILIKKEDLERAQRVLANSLSRRIIPLFTSEDKEKIEKKSVEIGAPEKRYLFEVAGDGWSEEKIQALTILSLCVEEEDLPALEKLFEETRGKINYLVLKCIERIGKTNKGKKMEKELLDAQWEDGFIANLDTLVAVRYKPIFSQLLKWLSNTPTITQRWRFWGEVNERKIEEKIQGAISVLLDSETYEQLVSYILDRYSPDQYGNVMSWRHFWVLREEKRPKIISLIKAETRLSEYEQWEDVLTEIENREKTDLKNKVILLSSIRLSNLGQTMLILRKVYELITPSAAFVEVAPLIEKMREELRIRLNAIALEQHPEEIKEIAKNDIEKFLGENRLFYRLQRKRKKGSRYESEGKKDEVFEKLSKDIDSFSTIEKEYLTHIFKAKTPESKKLLVDSIGRPYEEIYKTIDKETADTETLKQTLLKVIDEHPNLLVRLKAIEAALRTEVLDKELLRQTVLSILNDAKKGAKQENRGDDEWIMHEITYTWATNVLVQFHNPNDFALIKEEINREKIITRYYHRYSYFYDYRVFEELINLGERLEDEKERKNAQSALDSLDYNWTKKILNIED